MPELERRVAQLDEWLGNPAASPVPPGELISHFITVMQQVVDYGQPVAVMSATEADRLQRGCRLLQCLDGLAPQIVDGPLAANSQYWIGTGKPDHLPESVRTLRESAFVPVSGGMHIAAKPFGAGLFTSTGVFGDYGMWSSYLRLNQGSSLHPLPWYTWHARPHRGAVVREIASASAWVDLITANPMPLDGLIQPDWASIARSSDAVHMTLRAITATQGFSFRTKHGVSAAAYWDVESTFWLRWRFESADLVEITKLPAASRAYSGSRGGQHHRALGYSHDALPPRHLVHTPITLSIRAHKQPQARADHPGLHSRTKSRQKATPTPERRLAIGLRYFQRLSRAPLRQTRQHGLQLQPGRHCLRAGAPCHLPHAAGPNYRRNRRIFAVPSRTVCAASVGSRGRQAVIQRRRAGLSALDARLRRRSQD